MKNIHLITNTVFVIASSGTDREIEVRVKQTINMEEHIDYNYVIQTDKDSL
jgi:hypothetical protein